LPEEAIPNIEIESAAIDQSYVFENLIQLYIHDFTKYVPMKLGPDRRFAYTSLALFAPVQKIQRGGVLPRKPASVQARCVAGSFGHAS
jgi:hypothetical protein